MEKISETLYSWASIIEFNTQREEKIMEEMEEKEFRDLQEVLDHALKRAQQGLETSITINTPAGFKGTAVFPALKPPKSPEVKSLPSGGIHLASAKRIGDADRDKVIDQLWEAFAQGYLGNSEVNLRVAAAMEAEVREDLDLLVRDLEPLTPQKNISVPAPSLPVKKHHFGLINPGFSIIAMGIAFNLAHTTSDATAHGQGIIAVCSLVFMFFFVQLTRVVIKMIRKN